MLHDQFRWGLLILFAILVLLFIYKINTLAAPTASLQVSFIDVGQGDSALIQDSSGFDVLIDGGKTSAVPTVVAYLRDQGIDDIDVMVASHADSDHIGGLIDVLEMDDIPVQQVLYNGYPGNTTTWSNFVSAVAGEGLSLTVAQFPMELTWGQTTAYILNPISGLSNPDQNDASVVVMLDHNNIEFLFTGDISSTIEATVVARGTPVAAEILKVPHHGSKYSTSADFLSAVQPDEAVISVGSNPYGHPTTETLNRLFAAGARIWRTDEQGTILVTSNGFTYTIQGEIPFGEFVYLPLVVRPDQISTPIPPSTPSPTQTPTETPPQPPATSGNVQITNIFYDGIVSSSEPDEYVEIENIDNVAIQLQNWTLRDIANHVFTFPNFVIQPNQTCRIYTNQDHPEWCGFSYGSGSAIWNNSGDTATLRDSNGALKDEFSY